MNLNKQQEISVDLGTGYIPVTIGGIEFKLLTSDRKKLEYSAATSKLEERQKEIGEKADSLKEKNSDEAALALYEASKKACEEAVDLILGSGAFSKLYEAAGEDIEPVMDAFMEVMSKYRKLQDKKKMKQLVDGKKK